MQEARQPCPPPSLHSPGHLKQCRASETYENLHVSQQVSLVDTLLTRLQRPWPAHLCFFSLPLFFPSYFPLFVYDGLGHGYPAVCLFSGRRKALASGGEKCNSPSPPLSSGLLFLQTQNAERKTCRIRLFSFLGTGYTTLPSPPLPFAPSRLLLSVLSGVVVPSNNPIID